MVKQRGANVMLWPYVSVKGPRRLVRIEGRKNFAKYEENLLQNAHNLNMGQYFTTLHDNKPMHTAKAILVLVWDKSMDGLE